MCSCQQAPDPGDLLVRKAEEGVRVLLLIWNDVSRLVIMVFCDFRW